MLTIPFRGGAETGDGGEMNVNLGGESNGSFSVSYPQEIVEACLPLVLAKAASGRSSFNRGFSRCSSRC